MKVHQLYRGVFGEQANRQLYLLALTKREHFTHSKTSPSRYYPDWRRSTVMYDDQLAGATSTLKRVIRARLPQVLESLGIPAFDVGTLEVQLTSHNDGEYYHWHTDNGSPDTAARVVTFVYYFYAVPRRYAGGELVIYAPDGSTTEIDPSNDSLVFFDAGTKHEVRPVCCPTGRFEDGRFTLNGWVRKRTMPPRDEYFDGKIFSQPPRAGKGAPASQPAIVAAGARSSKAREVEHGSAAFVAADGAKAAPNTGALATALLNLYGHLYRQSGRAGSVDVLPAISGSDFFEHYYYTNRPVLLKGLLKGSPAVLMWSPEFFAEHYGSVPVQITTGRNSAADYERNFTRTTQALKLGDFVRRLAVERDTNDFYLVARNYFFENPTLRPLRSDVQPPADIVNVDDQGPGTAKLWFGPRATITPLHYDEHSILLAQIYGRKHFKLIPSFDASKVYVCHRFYSAVDPENVDADRYPDFLKATVMDVLVEPGDILFLPVGWWHWARSLDVSISATFSSFKLKDRNTVLTSEVGTGA